MRRTTAALPVLLLIGGVAAGQTAEQKKESVNFLRGLQVKDGGFLVARGKASSIRATSAALRGLKYFGGEAANTAAASAFVRRCYDASAGGFADLPGGKLDVFTTAVGFMAAVEVKLPIAMYEGPVLKFLGESPRTFDEIRIAAAGLEALGKFPPQREKWIEQVRKFHNTDGAAGKADGAARETGRLVVTLLRLNGEIGDRQVIERTLKSGQRADGGFGKSGEKGSDLESSYQVMRAFHMLKLMPDAGRMRDFIVSCRNKDGGYGVAPGKPSTAPATYYAAIILHWLGAK